MAYTLGRTGTIRPGESEASWLQGKDLRPGAPARSPFNGQTVLPMAGFDDVGVTCVEWNYQIIEGTPFDVTSVIIPFLTLTFNTDDSRQIVEVDLRRGGWYAAPARLVSVGVNYPRFAGMNLPDLTLSVSIGRGSPGNENSATRTLFATDGNGVPFGLQPIPSMAKTAILVAPVIANATLEQFANPLAAAPISMVSIGQNTGANAPIAQGAQFWQLAAAGAPPSSSVQFTLT